MADNVNQIIVDNTVKDQVQSVRLAEGEAKKFLSEMAELEQEIRSAVLMADIDGPVQPSYKVKRLEKAQEEVERLIDEKFALILLLLYGNFKRYAAIEAESIKAVFSLEDMKALTKTDIKKASSNVLIKDIAKDVAATPKAWIISLRDKIKEEVKNTFTFIKADILGVEPDESIVNTLLYRLSSKNATDTQNAGIFKRRNNNLKVLIVTSVLQVTNNTRQLFYKKNSSKVEYLIHISILDSSTCFTGGTKIKIDEGEHSNISDIKNGDTIVTHKNNTAKVIHTLRSEAKELIEIHLESGKFIHCTKDHLFLLENGEWMSANYLNLGDNLSD